MFVRFDKHYNSTDFFGNPGSGHTARINLGFPKVICTLARVINSLQPFHHEGSLERVCGKVLLSAQQKLRNEHMAWYY